MPIEPIIAGDSIAGIKYGTLLFAFLGSAASLSYAKEMTKVQAAASVAVGIAVAVGTSPLVMYYSSLPDPLERAVAFVLGLFAMRVVPTVLARAEAIVGAFKLPGQSGTNDTKE